MTITTLINGVTDFILSGIPILVSLALLYFFWGIADWILNMSGDAEKMKKGRERMVWGLIALFFMVSVAGVVSILSNTFFGSAPNHSGPQGNTPSSGTLFNNSTPI